MIELLIVLALLAILLIISTFQIVAYINRSRDGIRKSHLEKYRVALEEYFNDRRVYPPDSSFLNCGGNDLQPYLPTVYCDPVTKQPYRYELSPDGTGYSLYTNLADTGDPVITDRGCENGCGPDDNNDGSGDYNYGITDEQAGTGDAAGDTAPPGCSGPNGPYCVANTCKVCCPGVGWRCNPYGTGCESDVRCQ